MMLHVIRQAHKQHLTVTDAFRHLAYAKYNYSSQAATSTLTNARKNENIVHKFYKYFWKEEPTVEVKLQTVHLKKPVDLLPFTSTESHANEVTAELRGDGCDLENVEKFYEDSNIGEELNHVSNDRSQLSLDRNITTDVQCVVEKLINYPHFPITWDHSTEAVAGYMDTLQCLSTMCKCDARSVIEAPEALFMSEKAVDKAIAVLVKKELPVSIYAVQLVHSSRNYAVTLNNYLKSIKSNHRCRYDSLVDALPWSPDAVVDIILNKRNGVIRRDLRPKVVLELIELLLKYDVKPKEIVENLWLFEMSITLLQSRLESTKTVVHKHVGFLKLNVSENKLTDFIEQLNNVGMTDNIHPDLFNYITMITSVRTSEKKFYVYKGLSKMCPTSTHCKYKSVLVQPEGCSMYRDISGNEAKLRQLLMREGECFIDYFYSNLNSLLHFGFKIEDIAKLPLVLCKDYYKLVTYLQDLSVHSSIQQRVIDEPLKLLNLIEYQLEKSNNFVNMNAAMKSSITDDGLNK